MLILKSHGWTRLKFIPCFCCFIRDGRAFCSALPPDLGWWKLRKSTQNIHWKDWCWSWSSNTLTPNSKSLFIGKDPDTGKDWRLEEKETTVDWDGWMASPIQWTWVWGSSGRWWRTGKPGSPWGCKESSTTGQLNWKLYVTDMTWSILYIVGWFLASIHLLQLPSSLLNVYTQFPNKHTMQRNRFLDCRFSFYLQAWFLDGLLAFLDHRLCFRCRHMN